MVIGLMTITMELLKNDNHTGEYDMAGMKKRAKNMMPMMRGGGMAKSKMKMMKRGGSATKKRAKTKKKGKK